MGKILVKDLWIMLKKDINNANVIKFCVCVINELGNSILTELGTNFEHEVNYNSKTQTVYSKIENFTAQEFDTARKNLSYDSNALLFGLEQTVFLRVEKTAPVAITKLLEIEKKVNKIEQKFAINTLLSVSKNEEQVK